MAELLVTFVCAHEENGYEEVSTRSVSSVAG